MEYLQYRTSVRIATGETPYALTFGMEAVLPIELEIPSLRVLLENQVNEVDWLESRYEELALLVERRLRRMARAFNKKVKTRNIRVGDLVLREHRPGPFNPLGKWGPRWIGPYIVKKIFSGGSLQLVDLDGDQLLKPVNMDKLKKYFA